MFSPASLLLAAASVGILHMYAPDHWATLIILARVSKWNRTRLMEVGVMTAAGHVAISILFGFAIVEVGRIFSQQASVYLTEGTGVIMVVGGLLYGARELMSRGLRTMSGRLESDSRREKGRLADASASLPSWGPHCRLTSAYYLSSSWQRPSV